MPSGVSIHILSNIDIERRTATCRRCGEVRLSSEGRNRYRCMWGSRCAKRKVSADIPIPPKNCEICGRDKPLCLDHKHGTKKIRGFLCRRCNGSLGWWYENKDIFRKVIEYLDR